MSQRIARAFRAATPPTIGVLIVIALFVGMRWSKFADDPTGVAIAAGLGLVVFLTYFLLALSGFRVSRQGDVTIPRVYAWPLACAIVVVVFGALFYFLIRRS